VKERIGLFMLLVCNCDCTNNKSKSGIFCVMNCRKLMGFFLVVLIFLTGSFCL